MFLLRYYRQLIEQIDKWTSSTSNHYREHLACRKGCDLCCRRKISVTAVEAYNIATAFGQLPADIQHNIRKPKETCAFLIDGACSIYAVRPAICRTFGLPSLHRNESQEGVISWCELNFTQIGENFNSPPKESSTSTP